MNFQVILRNGRIPSKGIRTGYLKIDRWNDFAFVTMFYLSLYDDKGQFHDIGNVKIGFRGQDTSKSTYEMLGSSFERLCCSAGNLWQ